MSKTATKADKIEVEKVVHLLADTISPMYAEIAPASYQNMTGMCYKYFFTGGPPLVRSLLVRIPLVRILKKVS